MNLEILNRYYEEGWLIKQNHPELPLTILNKKDINPIIWKIIKPEWRKI